MLISQRPWPNTYRLLTVTLTWSATLAFPSLVSVHGFGKIMKKIPNYVMAAGMHLGSRLPYSTFTSHEVNCDIINSIYR